MEEQGIRKAKRTIVMAHLSGMVQSVFPCSIRLNSTKLAIRFRIRHLHISNTMEAMHLAAPIAGLEVPQGPLAGRTIGTLPSRPVLLHDVWILMAGPYQPGAKLQLSNGLGIQTQRLRIAQSLRRLAKRGFRLLPSMSRPPDHLRIRPAARHLNKPGQTSVLSAS